MPRFYRKTKEERQREIREAAKDVFLTKGYRYATMEDVMYRTTLSKGGVYQYYKSTKAIMFDIMRGGNYFRYSRSEEIIETLSAEKDVCEIITQLLLAKLFDKLPEKKLYVMFLSEIMYDTETEALFYELEREAWELMLQNCESVLKRRNAAAADNAEEVARHAAEQLSVLKSVPEDSVFTLYGRIFSGILIMYELLRDKKAFDDNRKEVHDFLYGMLKKVLP